MRTRWFGEPWPSDELRAPICEDEHFHCATPVGQTCVNCERYILSTDQGVVMAASPEVGDAYLIPLGGGDNRWVVASHLECFLLSILGPDVLAMVKRDE